LPSRCAARPARLDGRDLLLVELAHQLADELHLAALAFEVGDALGFGQRVDQLVGQLQALQQVARSVSSSLPRSCSASLSRLRSVLVESRAFEFGLQFKVESLPSATNLPRTK
jgi:hypothetical protein